MTGERIAGVVQKLFGDRRGYKGGEIAGEATLRTFDNPVDGVRSTFRTWIADNLVIEATVKPARFQRLGHDLRSDARGVAQRDPNTGTIWHLLRKDGCRLWHGGP